ncbi:MAG: DNA-formamidopyrimidine glycosylase [Gemmatimonadaceae bacterium]|nr:DNA-formamidopyrimidine glycosylase [Gloeobacterales cyanobacterium ES-bin-141]
MPELPEVETLRRDLLTRLPGHRVSDVQVLRAESVGYPLPIELFCARLRGQVFAAEFTRRGKYLLLHLEGGGILAVHLRMSGRLLWKDHDAPLENHVRVRIVLEDGYELHFEDPRVFGRLWLVPDGLAPESIVTGLARLGPEPFACEFSGAYLTHRFEQRRQPVKSALLDQQLVAGIGNIYADEALFTSRIHPCQPAGQLAEADLIRLHGAVLTVLEQGIDRRGSTLRNYTDALGVNGNYAGTAWVYGRRGQPCRICNTAIERVRLAGRSAHFCPACQKWDRRN